MSSKSDTTSIAGRSRRDPGRYFVVGGVIPVERSGYLIRSADEKLYRIAAAGEYAHVFAPRQSGKSSLSARAAERLRARDRQVAVVDISQIGLREGEVDPARWFYSFAFRLLRQLRIRIDLQSWWQDKAKLTNRQRLIEFYWDVILGNTEGPVTIFVDSPQPFDGLPFAGDLLASINSAHTARAAEPELSRLNFVLLGVREPDYATDDKDLSFFAASEKVELGPFTEDEILPLESALGLEKDLGLKALRRVFFWTSGQPFLTMKLARTLARKADSDGEIHHLVDDCVRQLFAHAGVFHSEPHLNGLQHALLFESPDRAKTLTLLGRIRKGERVFYNPESRFQRCLLEEGLLSIGNDDSLVIANRIYAMAFTTRWVNEHLPVNLRTSAGIAAGLLMALIIPLWYTQVLPRNWIESIQNPASIDEATDAHERMRAWPGHRTHANGLLADLLAEKSLQSSDLTEVTELDRLLRELPGTTARADSLFAQFWDRQALAFEVVGERDKALASRLNALAAPNPDRLGRASALIGEDYQHLQAAIRLPAGTTQAALTRDAQTLVSVSGTNVQAHILASTPPTEVQQWQASALEVFPVVSRIAAAGERVAGGFKISVGVEHDRPSDLILRLTAPSGRSVVLYGADAANDADGKIVFSSERNNALAELSGETRGGTWTLSVADRTPAIAGMFNDWALQFANSETFVTRDVDLLLREPAADNDAIAVLSPEARYVLAVPRSPQGVAQVWEVGTRQAVSNIPVTQDEEILGFVLDERVVLVSGSGGIRAYALATGQSSWAPPTEGPASLSALSLNGQFMALGTGAAEPVVEIYDLIEERLVGRLPTGISHDAISIANDGQLIAVADADQTVRLWRAGQTQPWAQFPINAAVVGLDFDTRQTELVIRTIDDALSIWPFSGEQAPMAFSANDNWQVQFDRGGIGMLLGNSAQGFQFFDPTMRRDLSPLYRPDTQRGAWQLQLRADRAAVLMFSVEQNVAKVFRIPLQDSQSQGNNPRTLKTALSGDASLLAVEVEPGELAIVNADQAQDLFENSDPGLRFLGHNGQISKIQFSLSGQLLASAATDGSVRVWPVSSGQPKDFFIRLGSAAVRALAFSPDDSRLAVATVNGFSLFDTGNGELLSRHRTNAPVNALAFSGSGEHLFAGASDGFASRLSLAQDAAVESIKLGDTAIVSVADAGTSMFFATAGSEIVRLSDWSVADPVLLFSGGEVCRSLVVDADQSTVYCLGSSWLRRFSLNAKNPGFPYAASLLPAAFIVSDLSLFENQAYVVTATPNLKVSPVSFSNASESAVNPADFQNLWRARLGFDEGWFSDSVSQK
ncbi:MAG: AAA-like domain-containing protein [Pseudomonadota bacterium]